jgi:predicted acyltransferase
MIMPLFLFMAGATIPFALAHYRSTENTATSSSKSKALWRIAKRVVVLWILGMMCQGNLLALDPNRIYLYTNTLQAIAVAYAIAALMFLFTRLRTQIIAAVLLLLAYWAAMEFITVDGFGGGDYSPEHNLAEWVDREVLGRFRDHAVVENGEIVWKPWYHYTWILSSLTFGVTGLCGMFAGRIAKSTIDEKKKLYWFFGAGIAMVAVAKVWSIWMPIIKTIWTSSMALFAAGISFILLGIFYYFIDYKGYRKGLTWLKVYGMNSIVAYTLTQIVNFRSIPQSLFFGLEQYLGAYYNVLITCSQVGIIFLILLIMYRKKIFLKA